jgi:hypothetical protein
MDLEIASQILDELFPLLEEQDTQISAVLQFLQDKRTAANDDLAPYLERAGNASNVRWRAVRVRLESLLTAVNRSEEAAKAKTAGTSEGHGKDAAHEKDSVEEQPERPAGKETQPAKKKEKEEEEQGRNGNEQKASAESKTVTTAERGKENNVQKSSAANDSG